MMYWQRAGKRALSGRAGIRQAGALHGAADNVVRFPTQDPFLEYPFQFRSCETLEALDRLRTTVSSIRMPPEQGAEQRSKFKGVLPQQRRETPP
jgi:hypothetical protein